MLDDHPFGPAGRTRRVDHVGRVRGGHAASGRLRSVPGDGVPVRVEADHTGQARRQALGEPLARQQDACPSILEHEGQPFSRIAGIQWKIGSARLQDAQNADHQIDGSFHADADDPLRTHSQSLQVAREKVRPAVQLPVGPLLAPALQGHAIGGLSRLPLETLVDAPHRPRRAAGFAPPGEQSPRLLRTQDVQLRDGSRRVGDDRLKHGLELRDHPNDPIAVEQVGVVLQPSLQAIVRARHEQREVELREPVAEVDRLDHEIRKGGPVAGEALQREHHLKERAPAQVPLRLKDFDQLLERQILMGLRPKGDFPHTPQELAEARVARYIGAQNQRIDEEPDQTLELRPGAIRHRGTHGDVGLLRGAVQQQLERGQKGHE